MAKVLISSLGTGSKKDGAYQKAKYQFDKETPYETSFIADAILKHHNIDKLFLVGTKKSIWDEVYATLVSGQDEKYYELLYEKKESCGVDLSDLKQLDEEIEYISSSKVIEYGVDSNEIWSNFEKFLEIANELEEGDELYLDITHSFRSLALMSFVMTQFASVISEKNFTIKAVYYGMFEYSSENDGVTPVVDINILLEIQEWIKAIDAIKKYSDFDPLVRLLEKENSIEVKVKNVFVHLNNSLEIANMHAIKEFIQTASKKIKVIEKSDNKIISLLAPEVYKLVNELNYEKMSDFQFALAKWFCNNKNYALSYMALAEAIVTKTCEIKGYDSDTEEGRKEAKAHIDYPWNSYFSATKKENGKIVDNIGSISSIRNSIAHQLERASNIDNDIKKLKEFLITFNEYFSK